MNNNYKVAILGAGSIGCFLGGCLAASGTHVVFVGRPRIGDVIADHGLRVTDYLGRDFLLPARQVSYYFTPEVLEQVDCILVTVKSGATIAAAEQIKRYAKSTCLVVSFQNGLHNADYLKEALPGMTILAGMVPFNVAYKENGHFHRGTEGKLALEESNMAVDLLVELKNANLQTEIYADIKSVQWGKLIMNLNNSVNALSGLPLLEQLHDRGYRRVLAKSIKEALKVFAKAGIRPARTGKVFPWLLPSILNLPNWLFRIVAKAMLKIDPLATSSMSEDLALERTTEIDILNGEIVTLAKRFSLTAPVNEKIVVLIKESEECKCGSPRISSESLLQMVSE